MACDNGGCSKSCAGGSGACPSCGKGCSSGCSFCSTSCGDACKGCKGCSGCGSGCASSCSGSCRGGCRGCGSGCSGSCSGGCSGGCSGCGDACSSSCTSCTGTCTDSCNNGCTGSNVTTVYTNLALQTIIKANDIINLNTLVNNEVTRRSKSATSTTITAGSKATAATINIIIGNLNKVASTQSANKAQYGIMDKASMQTLINLAKDLYTKNIKA